MLRISNGTEHSSGSCHSYKHVSHVRKATSLWELLMGSMGTNGPEMGDSHQGSLVRDTADFGWS